MKAYLGEFEELVLLTVATLGDDAYGVSISKTLKSDAIDPLVLELCTQRLHGWKKRAF